MMSATSDKLAALRAAARLKRGAVVAHHTATLPGVAASPDSGNSVKRLCRFKQRQGPFLLLADSVKTATSQVRYFSPLLRRQIKHAWPGAVTLIVPARPGLAKQCYSAGSMAIRVDASVQTRQLARACGGLLLSSSLNRKGQKSQMPDRKTQMRMHRFITDRLSGAPGDAKASTIIRVWRNDFSVIRP